jgi:hypothetical protein
LTIADFSTVLSSEDYLFAAHIADYNGGKSAKFATDGETPTPPVPEPGTALASLGLQHTAGRKFRNMLVSRRFS